MLALRQASGFSRQTLIAAPVLACLLVGLLAVGGANAEPLGVRPHYHGFHVGSRHEAGWRNRAVVSRGFTSGVVFNDRAVYYGAPYGSSWCAVPGGGYALVPWVVASPQVVVLPPVVQPAEWLFGPQALDRFLGLDRNAGNPLAARPAVPGVLPAAAGIPNAGAAQPAGAAPPEPAAAGAADPVRPDIRQSNAAARQRAGRFLEFGDNLFGQQRYHESLQRYKSAAGAAPDLAEPHFRQAQALIATSRFDLAAAAFRRGLALDDDVRRGGFQLDNLYGDAQLAKHAHLEALAQAALNRPLESDPLFLLGVFLFYDGQAERSRAFFARAAELSGPDAAHLAPFLEAMAAAPAGL